MKHRPERSCIVCRQRSVKAGLLRVVRTPQAEVVVDITGKMAGRGAYICRRKECAEQAIKQKKFVRALGMPVGAEIGEIILNYIDEASQQDGATDSGGRASDS